MSKKAHVAAAEAEHYLVERADIGANPSVYPWYGSTIFYFSVLYAGFMIGMSFFAFLEIIPGLHFVREPIYFWFWVMGGGVCTIINVGFYISYWWLNPRLHPHILAETHNFVWTLAGVFSVGFALLVAFHSKYGDIDVTLVLASPVAYDDWNKTFLVIAAIGFATLQATIRVIHAHVLPYHIFRKVESAEAARLIGMAERHSNSG